MRNAFHYESIAPLTKFKFSRLDGKKTKRGLIGIGPSLSFTWKKGKLRRRKLLIPKIQHLFKEQIVGKKEDLSFFFSF